MHLVSKKRKALVLEKVHDYFIGSLESINNVLSSSRLVCICSQKAKVLEIKLKDLQWIQLKAKVSVLKAVL